MLEFDALEHTHVGNLLQGQGVEEQVGYLLVVWLEISDEVQVTFLADDFVLLALFHLRDELFVRVEFVWNERLGQLVHQLLDLDAELAPD